MKSGIKQWVTLDNKEFEKFLIMSIEEIFKNYVIVPNFRYYIPQYNNESYVKILEMIINNHWIFHKIQLYIDVIKIFTRLLLKIKIFQLFFKLIICLSEIKVFIFHKLMRFLLCLQFEQNIGLIILKWKDLYIQKKYKKKSCLEISESKKNKKRLNYIKIYNFVYGLQFVILIDQRGISFEKLKKYFYICQIFNY
ncbi:unnamed protein product [Paramecium sonneborni]|uniref:Uncharacterized protein n=1 Tax=Paramecium sonneborni TaxID=65129 RepID=A0A8S1LR03_9CILI|nr:unnamed protein product [Paramecium sonneborni]